MVNEAKSHEAEDQQRRAEVETRNQADTLVYSTEKTLEDNKDKVPPDLKEEVEGKLATLRSAIQANSIPSMQSAMQDLNTSLQKLGEAVYAQTASDAPPSEETGSDGAEQKEGPEDTVEGEFRQAE